jgi:hypothetical protein
MADESAPPRKTAVARTIGRVTFWFALGHLLVAVVLYSIFWLPYREPEKQDRRLSQTLPDPDRALVGPPDPEPTDSGWVDREAGVVRIPVDEAMRIVAGRLPARNEAERQPAAPPTDAGSGRSIAGQPRP